jgi:hypothetical protein
MCHRDVGRNRTKEGRSRGRRRLNVEQGGGEKAAEERGENVWGD